LYAAISNALHTIYLEYKELSLLDIAWGWMALLPALADTIFRLDLIEPSGAMLARTTAALDARGVQYTAARGTLQDFMRRDAGTWM